MKIKKIVAATLASIVLTQTVHASVKSSMDNFFNSVGAFGNVTGPAVVSGQTGTAVVGGSMYMRAPQNNYQIAIFSPPSIKAGCGGIDLFAGSFFFMNSDQLVAMLQNLINNAIGVAFEMALEAISPQLAGILKWAQDMASKINSMNINTCQLAKGIVKAAWPTAAKENEIADRKGLDTANNTTSDSLQSWFKNLTDFSFSSQTQQTYANSDVTLKEKLGNINIVWHALGKFSSSVDNEIKLMLMSMTGTIIIDRIKSDGKKPSFRYIAPPEKINFKSFVEKAPGSGSNTIKIFYCSDNDCLNPGQTTVSPGEFYERVRNRLIAIQDKIISRQSQSLTEADYRILQGTQIPVWKILSMAGANPNISKSLLENAAKAIAVDIAKAFFDDMVKELEKAIDNAGVLDDPVAVESLEKIRHRVVELKHESNALFSAEMDRLNASTNYASFIALVRSQMVSNLSLPVTPRLSLQ